MTYVTATGEIIGTDVIGGGAAGATVASESPAEAKKFVIPASAVGQVTANQVVNNGQMQVVHVINSQAAAAGGGAVNTKLESILGDRQPQQ